MGLKVAVLTAEVGVPAAALMAEVVVLKGIDIGYGKGSG